MKNLQMGYVQPTKEALLLILLLPVSPPSCTFDKGWCQWRPLNSSLGFTWHMGSGPTVDRLSGPDGDHTTTR